MLAPLADSYGAAVIDGGTDAGVMQLMGASRAAGNHRFPLVGVAVEKLVSWPGGPPGEGRFALDRNHSLFLLLPGMQWGDESRWMSLLASSLSVGCPSITVLINGGAIAHQDLTESLHEGRPVLVLASSGRTADDIARSLQEPPPTGSGSGFGTSTKLTGVDIHAGLPVVASAIEAVLAGES